VTSEPKDGSGSGQAVRQSNSGEIRRFKISMDCVQDYRFRVRFDREQYADLEMDEPPPLGGDAAPNASRVLAAAIGNCLSASLLFCMRKARANVESLHTEVEVALSRNEKGRLRIGKIDVTIEPRLNDADRERSRRCLELFEDYCVVTQSVRGGIEVSVSIKDTA
jgi:organic hydroperoxide reductase OsmC/OhrA